MYLCSTHNWFGYTSHICKHGWLFNAAQRSTLVLRNANIIAWTWLKLHYTFMVTSLWMLFRLFWDFQVRYSDFPTCHDEQQQKPRLIQPTAQKWDYHLIYQVIPPPWLNPIPLVTPSHPFFFHTLPSLSERLTRGGFLLLTPVSHCPECESLGHVRALLWIQINRTHGSRCIVFALPVSAGPSNHPWSTILISIAFIHCTCRWLSNHCTQLQVVSEA